LFYRGEEAAIGGRRKKYPDGGELTCSRGSKQLGSLIHMAIDHELEGALMQNGKKRKKSIQEDIGLDSWGGSLAIREHRSSVNLREKKAVQGERNAEETRPRGNDLRLWGVWELIGSPSTGSSRHPGGLKNSGYGALTR